MKLAKRVVIAALTMAAFAPAVRTMAQYKPTGEDGITCSPKVRQALNDKQAGTRASAVCVVALNSPHAESDGIAASPKVRAQMADRHATCCGEAATAVTSASTTSKKNDGIAASPKVRQQMEDRGQ